MFQEILDQLFHDPDSFDPMVHRLQKIVFWVHEQDILASKTKIPGESTRIATQIQNRFNKVGPMNMIAWQKKKNMGEGFAVLDLQKKKYILPNTPIYQTGPLIDMLKHLYVFVSTLQIYLKVAPLFQTWFL